MLGGGRAAAFRQERSAPACRRPADRRAGSCRVFGCDDRRVGRKPTGGAAAGGVCVCGWPIVQPAHPRGKRRAAVALSSEFAAGGNGANGGRAAGAAGTDAVCRSAAGQRADVWRQRAALARALALQPELLVLDNPLGGLVARIAYWLVDFLDQLWRGHDFLGGRPMTLVATTDDLHPWQHPQRRFAAVHEGTFSVLGAVGRREFVRHQAVKELLANAARTRTTMMPEAKQRLN